MTWVWFVFITAVTFDVRYINLDARTDRRVLIEEEFSRQNISAVRIQAHKATGTTKADGGLACTISHIKAIKSIVSPVGLIVEDDAQFLRKLPHAELLRPSFDWDVLMLAYNGGYNRKNCIDRMWCRTTNVQTRSMYAVRKAYIPELVKVFKQSYHGLVNGGAYTKFAGDQVWKTLQRNSTHKWYVAVPRVARQRPGYSSITRSFENYNV